MKSSALNRVLYFSIPEQKIIFKCIAEYLKIDPENENARTVYEDFKRDSWLLEYDDK
jgi:hypothetical protein